MRPLVIFIFSALLLASCSGKMQQLEAASEKVKQCVNNCSLGTTSVCDEKKGKAVSSQTATDQTGGGDRVSNGWSSRLNLW